MTREEIFRDYEAFVAKFERLAAKTTDECITPPEVYCAVIEWLETEGLLNGRPIVRPFFPGGDYQNHDYPEGCIVVDNPPFSKSAEILRFYTANHIDFFLFQPYLTVFRQLDLTYIVADISIEYANGAKINTSFATSLMPGVRVVVSRRTQRHHTAAVRQVLGRVLPAQRMALPLHRRAGAKGQVPRKRLRRSRQSR